MKVVLFGATGMVGQGVLRECLLDAGVESVVAVGRTPTGVTHPKLRDVALDVDALDLAGFDACFFCLGVTSRGMSEDAYRAVTYDLTLAAARAMHDGATFVYVSGVGADSSERGRVMWARVRGETENALLALPLRSYVLRPGYIQPRHGARSKTPLYRVFLRFSALLYPLARVLVPKHVSSTDQIGRAMLVLARDGAPEKILTSRQFNALS
jgi:uncharacterized protein YbjT (DUF2867 family)